MKKKILSFILALTLVGGVALQPVVAKAYKDPVKVGQMRENESNDLEEDATRFYQSGATIYPMTGEFSRVDDEDWYVYESKETKKRKIRLGYSSRIGVLNSTVFLLIRDVTTDTDIFAESMPSDKASEVSFDAIEGHDYTIRVSLQGSVDELQARIDYFKEKTGRGLVYVLGIR